MHNKYFEMGLLLVSALVVTLLIVSCNADTKGVSVVGLESSSSGIPSLPILDGSDPFAQERADCVAQINGYRATEGKPPFEAWTEQSACSDLSAEKEYTTGTSHSSFGDCGENAQNLCPGYGSMDRIFSNCLVSMWNEGPGEPYSEHGHYINMSNDRYTKVACGFYEDPSGDIWHVQNFK
jgi:hypothetical protein